jgi:CRP-like cAMP-binding protein
MTSELVPMRDGRVVDTCPMGRDGLAGMPALLGQASFHHCVVQISATAWRVPAEHVRKLIAQSPRFKGLVDMLAHARFCQAAQFAACNLLHPIEGRLARWLLTTHFHSHSDVLNISQQFISEMLGANRSTTSTALNALQRDGLIRSERGATRLLDVARLREAACECYEVVEAAFAPLRGSIDVSPLRHA